MPGIIWKYQGTWRGAISRPFSSILPPYFSVHHLLPPSVGNCQPTPRCFLCIWLSILQPLIFNIPLRAPRRRKRTVCAGCRKHHRHCKCQKSCSRGEETRVIYQVLGPFQPSTTLDDTSFQFVHYMPTRDGKLVSFVVDSAVVG